MCLGKYCIGKVTEPKKVSRLTKLQREVMALRGRLPKHWKRKVNPAYKLFTVHGYYSRKRQQVWCEACGKVHHQEFPEMGTKICLNENEYVCPHCGAHLIVDECNVWTGKPICDASQYGYVTHLEGWTVFRVFYVERTAPRGPKAPYDVHEVWQRWISDSGREVILTKRYYRSPYYFRWEFDSEWRIGRHNEHCTGYYVSADVYDLYPVEVGEIDVSPILKRNGWQNVMTFLRVDMIALWQLLLTEPMAEELAKHDQYQVLKYWIKNCNKPFLEKWMHAVRICIRNGYTIKDAPMWFDHMELLEHFGKDTHSPHYVCPDDLEREHQRLVMKKQREEAAEELQKQIATISKAEPQYRKHRGMFFGCCFGDGDIMVTVLGSVRDIFEEGMMMKHCVFTNRYYDHREHPDSLILSARDSDGNRLETVEVNTRTWQVIQSRGFQNSTTDRHDAIVRIVNENMGALRKVV